MASHQLESCLKWAMGLAFIHRGQVSCVVHWLEVSNHFPSTASHVCQQSPRGLLGKQARVGVYLRMGHDALPGGSCGWGTQSPLAARQSATERGEPVRGESTGVWEQREEMLKWDLRSRWMQRKLLLFLLCTHQTSDRRNGLVVTKSVINHIPSHLH